MAGNITHSLQCHHATIRKIKDNSGHIEKRPVNLIMLVISGKLTYNIDGEILEAGSGDLLFLPQYSTCDWRTYGDVCVTLRVGFTFSEHFGEDENVMPLGNKIIKIPVNKNDYTVKFHRIINGYDSRLLSQRLGALAEIYDMLLLFNGSSMSTGGRIDAGVLYIDEHLFSDFYVEDAARECGLSLAQFRRLFKEKLGVTPVEYKNSLVMKKARSLLRSTDMTVAEIAASLGFDDIYSFSKFFKRNAGISPTEFRRDSTRPITSGAADG